MKVRRQPQRERKKFDPAEFIRTHAAGVAAIPDDEIDRLLAGALASADPEKVRAEAIAWRERRASQRRAQ